MQSAATAEALAQAILSEPGRPDFVSVHCACGCDVGPVQAALADGPAVLGATSCLGTVTQDGAAPALSAFVIRDPGGSFGSALRPFSGDPTRAAQQATIAALEQADRAGEKPELVWMAATPGREEAVLAGIEAVIGTDVPIIGGSAADDTVKGDWFLFDTDRQLTEGVLVAVMFPTARVSFAYQNGYAPTAHAGRVTRAEGRRILEIDDRPALEVYRDWTGGAGLPDPAQAETDTRPILAQSTFWPLGREISDTGGVPQYLLAHPAAAHGSGAIDLFANVEEGEVLTQMCGSVEGLTARAGRVAALARRAGGIETDEVAGALMVYCGGCMLGVRDHLEDVVAGVNAELQGAPFLAVFTFGEQGPILGMGNRHGNLMISCIVFG